MIERVVLGRERVDDLFPAEQREELKRMYLAGFRDAAKKSKAGKNKKHVDAEGRPSGV